ncbi:MAG: efflux RND transporter periplasmic adaptor subunit [Alphaproteobacteria bacterium]|nr:efflux RND transporter periplasmic adaptor subunit [Alphaproteobacteria bacterium]
MNKVLGRSLLFGVPILLLVAGSVLVFGALVANAPEAERADPEVRAAAVFVTQAQAQPVRLSVRTQGQVTALTEIDLTAQVAGRVAFVNPNFVQGGFFEAGEVLVQLEDADYRLAVTRAEAQVSQRRQALIREQAESELARAEWEAVGRGEATPLALREPQLADARAQLAAAEASLAEARLNLSRTRISAPFAGRVRDKMVDQGQFVGPGARLGRVFSTDVAEIRLPLSDREIALLNMPTAFWATADAPGPRVVLSAVSAGVAREWIGEVVRTDAAIDPQTRTLSVFVQVRDPYGEAAQAAGAPLAMGLFVEAHIEGREIPSAIVLPRSALRGIDEMFVAERDGTLSIREVTIIDSTADRVVVASGIAAGDRVITSTVRAPAPGMAVTAIGPDGEPLDQDARDADEAASPGLAAVNG